MLTFNQTSEEYWREQLLATENQADTIICRQMMYEWSTL